MFPGEVLQRCVLLGLLSACVVGKDSSFYYCREV